MGKIIERVRQQQIVAHRNRTTEAMYEAFCRYSDSQKDQTPVFIMKAPDPMPERPWWKFWG